MIYYLLDSFPDDSYIYINDSKIAPYSTIKADAVLYNSKFYYCSGVTRVNKISNCVQLSDSFNRYYRHKTENTGYDCRYIPYRFNYNIKNNNVEKYDGNILMYDVEDSAILIDCIYNKMFKNSNVVKKDPINVIANNIYCIDNIKRQYALSTYLLTAMAFCNTFIVYSENMIELELSELYSICDVFNMQLKIEDKYIYTIDCSNTNKDKINKFLDFNYTDYTTEYVLGKNNLKATNLKEFFDEVL